MTLCVVWWDTRNLTSTVIYTWINMFPCARRKSIYRHLRAYLADLLTNPPECSNRVLSWNGREGCSGMLHDVTMQWSIGAFSIAAWLESGLGIERNVELSNAINNEGKWVFCLICSFCISGVNAGNIGPKMGLALYDNGFLQLKNVRIPREHMMMKFAEVRIKVSLRTVSDKCFWNFFLQDLLQEANSYKMLLLNMMPAMTKFIVVIPQSFFIIKIINTKNYWK